MSEFVETPWFTGRPLKNGLRFFLEPLEGYCGDGFYPAYRIEGPNGKTIVEGRTCTCGRGCGGTDCVSDSWGYHDTGIEDLLES